MTRYEIQKKIGEKFIIVNNEKGEFSYPKAFREKGLTFVPIRGKKAPKDGHEDIDLRFVENNISVLVETKQDYEDDKEAISQLSAYIQYEKELTGNKIIAILANTNDDKIMVWRGAISDNNFMPKETTMKTFEEYADFYSYKINDKEKVMQNTYKLNETLHKYGISEKLRSQFVATCLLALKNNLDFESINLTAKQIITKIKEIFEDLLTENLEKATKIAVLNKNILESQDIKNLPIEHFRIILRDIKEDILPFINDKSTAGQDLLNLFFITFNKYVGKSDKNQAFTPDHITDFMSKITGVNKNSRILDICCGSGSFLVRAMTQALDDCATSEEQEIVKKEHIFGIEYDENIYGLATTNMLIHSDGNSNIKQGNCFDLEDWIVNDVKPTIILMNPPYNAQRKHIENKKFEENLKKEKKLKKKDEEKKTHYGNEFIKKWKDDKKEDPSKGLIFVDYIAKILNKAKIQATLAVLLPISCAIGTGKILKNLKENILKENTLEAVFTLPNEIFYPGASASACCMIFKIGVKHNSLTNPDTYFGYCKNDGFRKKKKLGRVEQIDNKTKKSLWEDIEKEWIELYRNRKVVDGKSATKKVNEEDEWIAEAFMKTDYSLLNNDVFEKTIRDYYSYLIKDGGFIKND